MTRELPEHKLVDVVSLSRMIECESTLRGLSAHGVNTRVDDKGYVELSGSL